MATDGDTPADLVGIGEVQAMLGGLSRQRTYVITLGKTFPAPVVERPRIRLWRRSDVEAWIVKHRPAPPEE